MGIQYFFPDQPSEQETRRAIDALGLRSVLGDDVCEPVAVQAGPGGHPGYLVARNSERRIGFYPKEQEWFATCSIPAHWLGITNAHRSPADFIRPMLHPGHPVRLADGNEWLVPCAAALPAVYRLDPDTGQMTLKPRSEFESFSTDALAVFGKLAEGGASHIEVVDICARALGLNYYVRRPEVLALGLIDQANYLDVFAAIQDAPSFAAMVEALKKNQVTADGGSRSTVPG